MAQGHPRQEYDEVVGGGGLVGGWPLPVFRRGFYFVLGLWYNLWRFRSGATLTGNVT